MMKRFILYVFMAGLVVTAPCGYAQKSPRSLARAILSAPASQELAAPLRQSLSRLTPGQLAQVTAQIRQANAQLAAQNAQTRQQQALIFEHTRPAVFRALPPKHGAPRNSFTGTIVKTQHQGKEEVYGVIPMHALADAENTPGLLSYKFTAIVDINGVPTRVPAWVVQLSTSSIADIALVKFPARVAAQVAALNLSQLTYSKNTVLYAYGYACNLQARGLAHAMGKTSAGLMTTQLPAANEGDRAGFCGSALVDENLNLAAIHIGSSYVANQVNHPFFNTFGIQPSARGDIGYAVPAQWVSHLIDAYHHVQTPVLPVNIRGQEIAKLRVNEYVSKVELLDKNHQVLWSEHINWKLSMRPAEKALLLFPQAKFIRLSISQTHWQKDEHRWFVEDDNALHRVVFAGIDPLE